MTTVYVVLRTDGRYSDATTSVHSVCASLERAERDVREAETDAAKTYGELYDNSPQIQDWYGRRGRGRQYYIDSSVPRFEIEEAEVQE